MKCNHCGLEHQDWLEHTSYEHLGVKACLVSLKRSEVVKAGAPIGNKNAAGKHELQPETLARGNEYSLKAYQAHEEAMESGDKGKHAAAQQAHSDAYRFWKTAGRDRRAALHLSYSQQHKDAMFASEATESESIRASGGSIGFQDQMFCFKKQGETDEEFQSRYLSVRENVKACGVNIVSQGPITKAFSADVIHCRATSSVGPALGASAAWEVGVPVSFMFMPAGTHTITAGFRKGSIELTVQCDESTAKAVQASLDAWRAERPKQQPFGCIEHREHEASVCVSASCGFEWKEDGVYLAAEPTSLGANNVNGKVHRSWSPSFTTDADYAKATEDGGTLRFPEGVRGSRSNPAQITGVDFCVGTLTNKPAFIEMKPVKARESDAVTAESEESATITHTLKVDNKVAAKKLESPFNTVLAREADADAILDKIVARNKPKPVTVDQLNAKFGQTKTGDTRKTPDEIMAGIYARAGLSR
jgi:hypothetical protein